jgi:L-alanine-DL-glutamate epimerase-like enolase superfamily enzyme
VNTFALLADLEVEIDSYTLDGLQSALSPELTRHTTEIALHGAGLTGRGEDVVYQGDEQLQFQQTGPIHDMSGRRTIAEFCDLIERLDLFPVAPVYPASRLFRVWAFESAALDLALLQSGRRLSDLLGRTAHPMRYVASTRLGDPPTVEPVTKRLALDPTLRFKLDATSSWTPEIFEQLVATKAVDSVDFKGMYRGTIVDQRADATLYQRVVEAFPDAWLEDPDLSDPGSAAVLAAEHDRITWDAPIHGISDIKALPFAPKMVNIKPSRIGSLRELCATYDYCEEHGIGSYGGGQNELGIGRGQAQYLAALFHADTPNDLAPAAYNQPDPPSGLPSSPLVPDSKAAGFQWRSLVP